MRPIAAHFDEMGKAFSDNDIGASLVTVDGDAVVAERMGRITPSGALTMADGTEIAPTDKTVEGSGVTVGRVRDGKFAAFREYYDSTDL